MTTKELVLSRDLHLPSSAVTQRQAFLGLPGSGKSYAATKEAELMYDVGAQFVAIDPVGIWYGLRLDGKGKGLPIPVFGGLRGDIPLEPTSGAMMADLIVDRRLTCVLDVSQFEHDTDKARFATGFAARFFWRMKASPSAVHVFLEECQEFVPQNPAKGEETMLHNFVRMTKLGRNYGIGMSLISQRPQEINKKALNLTECLFAFQMSGSHERKAIRDWVQAVGADEKILDVLPTLEVAHAHVYSPRWLRVSKTVKIGEKRTADVSSTPSVGQSTIQSKPLAKIDLELIRKEMASTIERAKADDPKALRAEIAKLKKEVSSASRTTYDVSKIVSGAEIQKQISTAVTRATEQIRKDQDRQSRLWAMELRKIGKLMEAAVVRVNDVADDVEKTAIVPVARLAVSGTREGTIRITPAPKRGERVTVDIDAMIGRSNGSGDLPKGEKIVLNAIAQFDGADMDQLSVITGYKKASRDAYIARLKKKGFLEIDGGRLLATDAGMAALGSDFEPLPTGVDLRNFWIQRLPAGESVILQELIHAPKGMRSSDFESRGYKPSSIAAYVTRLKAKRLVIVENGVITASPSLF